MGPNGVVGIEKILEISFDAKMCIIWLPAFISYHLILELERAQ